MVEPASRDLGEAVEMSYVVCGEERGEDVADKTSNGVLGEDIEGVVDAEDELELGGIVGACGSDDSVDDCRPGGHESGTGSNGNETSHNSRAESNCGPFAFETVIKDTPGDTSDAGGQVGYNCGHDSAHVGCESGTSVESEPTNPEEDGTDDNVCNIVRTIIEFVSLNHLVSFIPNWGREGELTPWPRRLPNMME